MWVVGPRNKGHSAPFGDLQVASPFRAQLGIQGRWCQPYLMSTDAKATGGSGRGDQNIRDMGPSNWQVVGELVHAYTHLLV